MEEVASHNTKESAWFVIDSIVYDLTKFAAMHPGGEQELMAWAGKDCTSIFYELHRQVCAQRLLRDPRGCTVSIDNNRPCAFERGAPPPAIHGTAAAARMRHQLYTCAVRCDAALRTALCRPTLVLR